MDGQCLVLIISTEGNLVFMEWTDSVGFLAEVLRVIWSSWNGWIVLGSYHKH